MVTKQTVKKNLDCICQLKKDQPGNLLKHPRI